MEYLKEIKCKIENFLYNYIESNEEEKLNAHEIGEVTDIIKDLAEAMYYSTIVEAMENATQEEKLQVLAGMNPVKK